MGKKILLADDSITIQKVIELTFSDEDFEVVTVGNGRLAIEKVQEIRPDIVLCDIIMPEKDGYEVCDFIKKNPQVAHVPVLLLTGAFEPFDQERAQRVGYDGSLAKPFEPETLIAKVKELLRKASSSSQPRITATLTPPPLAAPPLSPTPDLGMPAVRAAEGPKTEAFTAYVTQPTNLTPGPPPPSPPRPSPPVKTFTTGPATLEAEPVLTPEPEPEPEAPYIPDEPFTVLEADAFAVATEAPPPPPPSAAPRAAEPPAPAYDPDLYAPADDIPFLEVTAEESASLSPPASPPPAPSAGDSSSTVMFKAGSIPWTTSKPEPPVVSLRPAPGPRAPAPEPPELEEVFEEESLEINATTHPSILKKGPLPAEPPPPPRAVSFEPGARFEPPVFAPMETLAAPPPAEDEFPPPLPEPASEPELIPMFEPATQTAAPAPAAPAPPPAASFADLAPERGPEPPPLPRHSEAAEVKVPVDMVEKIAQRVVAQISEKVIQQIAWEVIPDLAEAMIRKEIERLKAELQQV